jgi:hypothetical protein
VADPTMTSVADAESICHALVDLLLGEASSRLNIGVADSESPRRKRHR